MPQLDIVDLRCSAGTAPGFDFSSPEPLLAELDRNGVARAVLGPIGSWAAVEHDAGDEELRRWCRRWPDRFGRWASVNPWWPDAPARLRRLLDAGALGLQLVPAVQGFSLLQPDLVEPLLEVSGTTGTPVYVVTGVPIAAEPLQLTELARRHPELTFVMGRSGRTDFALDLLPAAAAVPNIVVETAYNAGEVIRDCVERLGAHRVAFVSDAPFNDVDLELRRIAGAALPQQSLRAVLAGTAQALLGDRAR